MSQPERTELASGLEICRVVTGLWQIADMERSGVLLDRDESAASMAAYATDGFDTFDMADHYGSAEDIAGHFLRGARNGSYGLPDSARPHCFTKWCPEPGPMDADVVEAGIGRSLDRLGVDAVDLMQFHWWTYDHPAYIDALSEMAVLREAGRIRHIGLTNVDTDHLRLLVSHGVPIVSNQVSFSLVDRRAGEAMAAYCTGHGVKLLAYGTLCGGFLSDRWLDQPEPAEVSDWSKMKYKRFIDAAGGWEPFQAILRAARRVADKHGVSLSNVATRWVLDQPAVAAVIIGARLGEREHRDDNRRLFSFALDEEDRALIDAALAGTNPIPGDCGDEYRRPPFLTAAGDLSHHLESVAKVFEATPVPGRPDRLRVDTGSVWEPVAGYSRAMRVGDRVLVSGTTATHGTGEMIAPGDPAAQTTYALDKIMASLAALGAAREDVVRTRIYIRNADDWEAVSRAHGRYFGDTRPANSLLEVGKLVGDYAVEIEAEAIVDGT